MIMKNYSAYSCSSLKKKNPQHILQKKKKYLEYKEKEDKCKKRFIETVVVQEETYNQNGLNK